jgi:uncharacterized protein (TIGR02594 family)
MKLVAEVVDKYSGPLREMNKAFRALQSNIKGTHATGTAQAKEQAKANKELHDAVEKVRGATTAFTPALAAVGITALSVGGAITGLVTTLKSLGDSSQSLTFLSRRTKLTTDELRTFEEMGERVGVSSDTMASGLANFGQFMDENTRRVPAAVEKWKALRGSFEGLGASLRGLSRTDQIHRVFDFLPKIHDMDQRRKLLALLGLPEDLANASREELAKAERAAEAFVKAHPLDIGKGLKAKEAFLDLHEAIEGLKTDLSVEFAPGLTKTIKGLSEAVELAGKGILKLEEIIHHLKEGNLKIDLTPEKGSLLDDAGKYLHDPDRGKKLIDRLFGRDQDKKATTSDFPAGGKSQPITMDGIQKLFGRDQDKKATEEGTKKGTFDGLMQFFQLQNYQPGGGDGGLPVVKASYNPGGGDAIRGSAAHIRGALGDGPMGDLAGGSRGNRNNNRGNMKFGAFAKAHGATGADARGFAIFPDQATGDAAHSALLQSPQYKGLTLDQFGNKYAQGSADWKGTVGKELGIGRGDIVNNMDPRLSGAVRKAEGTTGDGGMGHSVAEGKQIPVSVLSRAAALFHGGGNSRDVQEFMKSQGYPQSGAWCGKFAASVVRAAGGTVPAGAAIASNWRKYGHEVSPADALVGDIAVRRGARTGSKGSHVGLVDSGDAASGRFSLLGGNQGRAVARNSTSRYQFYHANEAAAAHGEALRRHFGHPHRDLLQHAQRAGLIGGSQKVVGDASLKIDLNGFPKGARTKMAYGGMFKDVKLNRGSPMALASEEA